MYSRSRTKTVIFSGKSQDEYVESVVCNISALGENE